MYSYIILPIYRGKLWTHKEKKNYYILLHFIFTLYFLFINKVTNRFKFSLNTLSAPSSIRYIYTDYLILERVLISSQNIIWGVCSIVARVWDLLYQKLKNIYILYLWYLICSLSWMVVKRKWCSLYIYLFLDYILFMFLSIFKPMTSLIR